MPQVAKKVTNLNRVPVDILNLYTKLSGETAVRVAEDEYHGKCFVHDDQSASCHYNPVKSVFHCKACNAGGNAWLMVQKKLDLGPTEATQWLMDNQFIQNSSPVERWKSVDVTYDYVDEDGNLLLQVGRWNNPKSFGQRIPHGDGWSYSLKDLKRRVPFMLPDLMKAIARGETIYVVEGEKDAQNLFALGLCATTNPQGAKWKWPIEWADFFKGAARVIVIADNDKAGRDGAQQRAGIIARECANTYVVAAMPSVKEKGDVSDWLQEREGDVASEFERVVAELGVKANAYEPKWKPEHLEALVNGRMDAKANGIFMAAVRSHKLCYRPTLKKWARYRRGAWTLDEVNPEAEVQKAIDILEDAASHYRGERADDLDAHVGWSRTGSGMRDTLTAAKGQMGRFERFFDANPQLLNVSNGTLDLGNLEGLTLRQHSPSDWLTLMSPVSYDADATCPNFEKWLMDACNGSQPLFDYMQQVMGSCLEGKVGTRRFYFIFGPKGTGKSTFIRTLEKLLGRYQCATSFKALSESKFADGNGPTPALARLKGRRMVSASEAKDSDKLDVGMIKSLIGGDSQTARNLNEGIAEFKFEATLILSGNEMPRIIGDESIWDKFKPVPFMHEIDGEDPNFEAKHIDPELSGILNFAIDGLRKLRANGYRLDDPAEVREAREQERDVQDPFAEWFGDSTEKAPDECPCDALYANYAAWCVKNKVYQFKRQKLTRWLKEKHGIQVRQNATQKWYVGVRPKFKDGAAVGF